MNIKFTREDGELFSTFSVPLQKNPPAGMGSCRGVYYLFTAERISTTICSMDFPSQSTVTSAAASYRGVRSS